jgi:glycosyltransferase involved in cell wall biosynthesis
MNVLHISTSDKGGAGIAAVRLHNKLMQSGVQSKLLTLYKHSNQIKEHYQIKENFNQNKVLKSSITIFKKVLNKLGIKQDFYSTYSSVHLKNKPEGFEFFSFPISEFKLDQHPLIKWADIIHLHWVSEGFLDYNSFFKNCRKNIIWTLHDMNPFTGGCHHSDGCMRFINECNTCPQIKDTIDEDIAGKMLDLKKNLFDGIDAKQISIVTPSNWLGNLSQSSRLFKKFKHNNFYNISDTNNFIKLNKYECRKELGLPIEKKIILFVAHNINNPRKGINYLLDAKKGLENYEILYCSVGHLAENFKEKKLFIQLGYVGEAKKMAQIYNAADVFILPSIGENFPNTITESLLCGTPVIAFNVGGIPEQIDESNGIIVSKISSQCLTKAMNYFFENIEKYNSLDISKAAKQKYNQDKIIAQHIDLYKKMIHA